MPIENVSDTARWVAYYRGAESERSDALFKDPFAMRLAGARAKEIVASIPQGGSSVAKAVVIRTVNIDALILDLVNNQGIDLVVNIAAGLDSRPWRMPLPASLQWIDVDLPGILNYKTETLRDEKTNCRYEAVPMDLRDSAALDAVLGRVEVGHQNALVITEGLLIYLDASEVTTLAKTLQQHPVFKTWITDLASPLLLQYIARSHGKYLQNAPMKFGPAEGTAFFRPFGWEESVFRSTIEEGRRLGRPMPKDWLFRLFVVITPYKRIQEVIRMSGVVLLKRSAS